MCRFAHYLKVMARDKIGSFKEREDMQNWLQNWITRTTSTAIPKPRPRPSRRSSRCGRPRSGRKEVEGNPGYYNARFYLRPHYQLEGVNVSLRLVSKLPSAKSAA